MTKEQLRWYRISSSNTRTKANGAIWSKIGVMRVHCEKILRDFGKVHPDSKQ
jgi:hypothetical protein